MNPLRAQNSWEGRLNVVISATENNLNYSEEYKKMFMTCIYKRLIATSKYNGVSLKSINAPVTLIRPGTNMLLEYEEDYGLSKVYIQYSLVDSCITKLHFRY